MDRRLLELLVCPLCKGPLEYRRVPEELVCPADRLAFPVRDGIAVMLEAEARSLDDAADDRGPAPAELLAGGPGGDADGPGRSAQPDSPNVPGAAAPPGPAAGAGSADPAGPPL